MSGQVLSNLKDTMTHQFSHWSFSVLVRVHDPLSMRSQLELAEEKKKGSALDFSCHDGKGAGLEGPLGHGNASPIRPVFRFCSPLLPGQQMRGTGKMRGTDSSAPKSGIFHLQGPTGERYSRVGQMWGTDRRWSLKCVCWGAHRGQSVLTWRCDTWPRSFMTQHLRVAGSFYCSLFRGYFYCKIRGPMPFPR